VLRRLPDLPPDETSEEEDYWDWSHKKTFPTRRKRHRLLNSAVLRCVKDSEVRDLIVKKFLKSLEKSPKSL